MLRKNMSLVSLVAGLLLTAPWFTAYADQSNAPVAHRHRAHRKPAPLVLPPLPAGPLRQVPLDQLPPSVPHVTYENGLLSIAAQNSTLGEILRDVRQLTGASVELPPNGAPERVVTQLGPGAPRDVLAMLLNGTAFNYVMLGSTTDPNAVATIVLTPRPSSGEGQTVANAASTPQPQPQPMVQVPSDAYLLPNRGGSPPPAAAAAAEADDNSDDADDDKDDDSDQAQPAQPGQPGPAGVTQPDANNSSDQQNQPNAGPRTPEQILDMLRRGQTPPGAPPGFQPPPGVVQQPPQQ